MTRRILTLSIGLAAAVVAAGFATTQSPSKSATSTEWPPYVHDSGGMRFSPVKQVTTENVSQLEVAWTYHMRPPAPETPPAPAGGAAGGAAQPPGRGRGRGGSGFS